MVKSLRYRIIFFISVFLLTTRLLNAQHAGQEPLCGTDEMNRELWKKSSHQLRHDRAEELIWNQLTNLKNKRTTATGTYMIPVVVHVIHQNGVENISEAQILSGLQHLNDAFNNAGDYTTPLGVPTTIQFCLAKQDAQGNPSTGITRHQSPLTNILAPSQDVALKNIIRWDPTRYINIWLVKEITSESAGAGVAGYAFFPSAHGTPEDGLVCEARYFGGTADDSKVAVHELGHYFGLYHTFEGGCVNTNCLLDGDRVCDTQPDGSSSPALCQSPVNSCNSDSDDHSTNNPFRPLSMGGIGDQADPMDNYMDYGNLACQILFTAGQKDRMIAALTGLRGSLLESTVCNDLCPNPIQVSFTPSDTIITIGTQVQFNNTTTGGAIAYEWLINGVLFSSLTNPSYTFNQQGVFTITLKAISPAGGACNKEMSRQVTVQCPLQSAFKGPASLRPGESITYANTTAGTNSYQWFVNASPVATTQDLTHTFGLGGFTVSLVAFNGQCYDTSSTLYVQSASCNLGNESKIWYFGQWAGLDFSGDTAVPIYYPFTTDILNRFSDEACISMSDASGNHIFYSTPNFVFNKNRTQMPNGSGLLGHASATQMAAVADPGNINLYYLFTLDAFGGANGLRYSVIDMSLDGGLGDVVAISKNTLLLTPVTEKISTVKHSNGTDTWVIVHEYNTDAFYAYLVTPTGISATPVITHIGSVHSGNSIGQLKFSPDGCKIALAMADEATIELFNFNNQTGVLSSVVSINNSDYQDCYGVEFSPDGSKLYIGTELTRNIYQFDMGKTTSASITASRVLIGHVNSTAGIAAFQLGPYGKIYVARTDTRWLGVINNPNAPGILSGFVANGVNLGLNPAGSFGNAMNKSGNGLPCFSQQYFYDPKPVITGRDNVCVNSTAVQYKISGSSCASFGNSWLLKGKGTLVSSNDTMAVINFSGAEGMDTLVVERNSACGITVDTLFIHIRDVVFDIPDTIRCTASAVLLDAGTGFITYEWQDHSTAQTFIAPAAGKYWLSVTTREGCSITDTVHVKNHTAPAVSLGPNIARCPGAITLLDAGVGYPRYLWQDHSAEQTFSAYLPGKYWVTVTDVCGSKASDTLYIAADMDFSLGGNKHLCNGETIVLDAGNNYTYYQWQDHSSTPTFSVTHQGTYSVVVSDGSGCYGYDTIQVYTGNDCCEDIKIPSLITPNHDGKNEAFEVSCIANNGWLLEIYNRWGGVVYRNDNYANNWNAENNSDGVYFYLLKKGEDEYRGWVQVTR
ncbi:MAG: hypothetical protein JWM14_615 [Chitinophagaceae bacterium]|nr:hypothetical protein [Chitinophagaceae bacterium]